MANANANPRSRLRLFELSTRVENLLNESRSFLARAPGDEVTKLARDVPTSATGAEDTPPTIAFVGGYSSGKSALLRVITGRKELVSRADICTSEVTGYDLEGIRVLDTPGIHTETHPEHDAMTYEAIVKADLLVFVVSNEGFDDRLAGHFRELAVERSKGAEMMLVVNKIDRAAQATPEWKATVTRDLARVVAPLTLDNLRVQFVSAEWAEKARADDVRSDPGLAAEYWADSGIDGFVDALDRFAAERGVAARFTTGLYTLEHTLMAALARAGTTTPEADALEEALLRKRTVLEEARRNAPHRVHEEAAKAGQKVRVRGNSLAGEFGESADKATFERQFRAAQSEVEALASETDNAVGNALMRLASDVNGDLAKLAQEPMLVELTPLLGRVMGQVADNVALSPRAQEQMGTGARVAHELGAFLVKHSFDPSKGTLGGLLSLRQYSGTATANTVKEVGKLLGYRMWPWQAAKVARTLATVGRVLGVAAAAISVFLEIKGARDEERRREELRRARDGIRVQFDEYADALEMHYDSTADAFVHEAVNPQIQAIDDDLSELRRRSSADAALRTGLEALLDRTRSMIREVQVKAG